VTERRALHDRARRIQEPTVSELTSGSIGATIEAEGFIR
jgi:hypothetical protein